MPDDVATTALIYDASGAAAGAAKFVEASNKIINSAQQIQDALAKGAAGVDNFSKSTQRISDSFSQQTRFLNTLARAYDPLSVAVQKAQRDLDRLNGVVQAGGENAAKAASMIDEATRRLVSAQNAAAGANQLKMQGLTPADIDAQNAALKSQSAALGGVSSEIIRLNTLSSQLTLAQAATTRQMQTGVISTQVGTRELLKYDETAINTANALRLLNSGQLSVAQVAQRFPSLFTATAKGFQLVGNEVDRATTSYRYNRGGLMELQAAGINTFQALAAGMNPLRVAETELAQVLGGLIQTGIIGFGKFLLWVAPVAALGVAITALAVTISNTSGALQEFSSRLNVSNVSGTAQQYDDLAHKLAIVGVSTAEARTALQGFISTVGITHTLPVAQAIGELSQKLRAVRPDLGSFSETFKSVTDAIAAGPEGVDKLAQKYGVELPVAIQKAMREVGNVGYGLEYLDTQVKGAAKDMGFWGTLWDKLGRDWQEFAGIVAVGAEGVITWFGKLTEWIGKIGKSVNGAIAEGWAATSKWVADTWKGAMAEVEKARQETSSVLNAANEEDKRGWSDVAAAIESAWTTASARVTDAWAKASSDLGVFFTDTIPKAWASLLKMFDDTPVGNILDELRTAAIALAGMFTTTLPNAWKTFANALSDIGFLKTIEDAFTSFFAGIENKIDSLTSKGKNWPGLGAMVDKLTGRVEPMGPPAPPGFAPPGLGSGQLPAPEYAPRAPLARIPTPNVVSGLPFTTQSLPFPSLAIPQGTPIVWQGPVTLALPTGTELGAPGFPPVTMGHGFVPASAPIQKSTVPTEYGNNLRLSTAVGGIGTQTPYSQNPLFAAGAVTQDQLDVAQKAIDLAKQSADLKLLNAADATIEAARTKALAESLTIYKKSATDANGVNLRDAYVTQMVAAAKLGLQNELTKTAAAQEAATAGQLSVTDATRQSAVAGAQAAAAEKERVTALTSGAGATEQAANAQRALTQDAVAALLVGQQQINAGKETLANNQAIAAAALQGREAEQQAGITIAANVQTHDAYNKALETGNKALIDRAAGLQAEAEAQIKANDQAVKAKQLADQVLDIQDQNEQLQLQLNLVGQTTGEIQKQLTMLQAIQQIKKLGQPLDSEAAQAMIKVSAASAELKQHLADAHEGAQRLNNAVAGIADTISSSIGQTLQDAFDNKKTIDWGQTMRGVLAQIANQIVQLALIRPAIGSVLAALNMPGAAQQFGTFGQLFQAIGNIGGGSGTTNGTGTSSGGGIGVGDALSTASSAKTLIGGDSGGGWFSGLGNAVNTFGYNIGLTSLVPSQAAISTAAMWGGGGEIAAQAGLQGAAGLGEGVLGLAGGLMSAIPYVGAIAAIATAVLPMIFPGFMKGSMNYASQANLSSTGEISLSGQNQQNSQIASGILKGVQPLVQVLSAAGLQVPGVQATYGTKTGYQAIVAGDTTDIKGATTAQIAQHLLDVVIKLNPGFKSLADILGNMEKLQPVLDDTSKSFDDLSTIFTNMQTTLKATQDAAMAAGLPIDELNQRFSELGQAIINSQIDRLGTTIGTFLQNAAHSVADFASAFSTLSSAYQTAISEANAANLSITGISNRFRGLAIQLRGPELRAAISGLNDSFKSLQPGQYAAALDQVGQVFNSIFAQLVQFNAAGSEIWQAQDKAKANLRAAFNHQMSDLILGFTNPAALAIKQEKAAGAARVADARAIGASLALVNEYNKLSLHKVMDANKALAASANGAAQSVQQLVDAINQLKGGQLSGLSPGKQAAAAYTQFETQYRNASNRGNDPAAFAQLGALATAAVQAFQAAYGNTAQTEAHRQVILKQLQTALKGGAAGFNPGSNIMKTAAAILESVLHPANAAVPAFASGTSRTPPGAILVGERGPEIIHQAGGLAVTPMSRIPAAVAAVAAAPSMGRSIDRLVRVETRGGFDRIHQIPASAIGVRQAIDRNTVDRHSITRLIDRNAISRYLVDRRLAEYHSIGRSAGDRHTQLPAAIRGQGSRVPSTNVQNQITQRAFSVYHARSAQLMPSNRTAIARDSTIRGLIARSVIDWALVDRHQVDRRTTLNRQVSDLRRLDRQIVGRHIPALAASAQGNRIAASTRQAFNAYHTHLMQSDSRVQREIRDSQTHWREIQKVMSSQGRAFAGGTTRTPSGAILVGERGPEIIHQAGGLAVTPIARGLAAASRAVGRSAIDRYLLDRHQTERHSIDRNTTIDRTRQIDRHIGASHALPMAIREHDSRTHWNEIQRVMSSQGRAFAGGTQSTPSGPILVGERGVEIVHHPLTTRLPSPATNVSGAARPHQTNTAWSRTDIAEIRTTIKEMGRNIVALRRQVQGGQVQAHDDATQANAHLGSMKTTIVHAAAMPKRRTVG